MFKELLRDGLQTLAKSVKREMEKYKGNKVMYGELERQLADINILDNKIALRDEAEIKTWLDGKPK